MKMFEGGIPPTEMWQGIKITDPRPKGIERMFNRVLQRGKQRDLPSPEASVFVPKGLRRTSRRTGAGSDR